MKFSTKKYEHVEIATIEDLVRLLEQRSQRDHEIYAVMITIPGGDVTQPSLPRLIWVDNHEFSNMGQS